MKRMRMSLLSLAALALLAGPGIVQDAKAGIRINATLHTPTVRVCIGNAPSCRYRSCRGGYLPVRVHQYYRVDMRDRKIAHRLARYTGVPSRKLIQLKRRGYHWFEIGRWLHVPRPVVRAAMDHRSWKRFLREERRYARRGAYRRGRRQVVYFYND